MKKISGFILFTFLAFELTGCAAGRAWKGLVDDDPDNKAAQKAMGAKNGPAENPNVSFNTNPNYGTYQERQYHRVTKQNFSEDQKLEDNAGSLWKKEGQSSFLFAQNNLRIMGDVINVDVDGKVSENLNTKVFMLKKAQAKFDAPAPKPAPKHITQIPRPDGDDRNPASLNTAPKPPEAQASNADEKDKKDAMKFDPVTCRIVEKNTDGSYRIKGTQALIIGRKEYRLIVTGIVRADDINTDSIAATKIMESKFDLVATYRDVDR